MSKYLLVDTNLEVWAPVLGFRGLYEVSTSGRVRSLDRIRACRNGGKRVCRGRLLKPGKHSRGYLQVQLCDKKGRPHTRRVHRLVLEAFVGPCPSGMECRHFPDPDKTNNYLTNLSWGTPKQNGEDAIVHGTHRYETHRGSDHGSAKLTEIQVINLRQSYSKKQKTMRVLAKEYGVTVPTVWGIVHHKTWKHV